MDPEHIAEQVRRALAEDVGNGDVTARLIPAATLSRATVVCRENAVLCGTAWFERVFREIDARVAITWRCADGAPLAPGEVVCELRGPARALLSGERTALNFLQTLSGTATAARRFRERCAGLPVTLLDTRKTLPGLRGAQKYAVRLGGCRNHRMGLFDAVLIKENHIAACGSIAKAVENSRICSPGLPVTVEVEDLAGLAEALDAGADTVLLDNFDLATLRRAVELNQGRARLEASGGVTLENVRAIADTGVDFISIGALTKDLRAIDYSMRIDFDR